MFGSLYKYILSNCVMSPAFQISNKGDLYCFSHVVSFIFGIENECFKERTSNKNENRNEHFKYV